MGAPCPSGRVDESPRARRHLDAARCKSRSQPIARADFPICKTHGTLDVEHTALYRKLVDSFEDRETQDIVIDAARVMYRLYGGIL